MVEAARRLAVQLKQALQQLSTEEIYSVIEELDGISSSFDIAGKGETKASPTSLNQNIKGIKPCKAKSDEIDLKKAMDVLAETIGVDDPSEALLQTFSLYLEKQIPYPEKLRALASVDKVLSAQAMEDRAIHLLEKVHNKRKRKRPRESDVVNYEKWLKEAATTVNRSVSSCFEDKDIERGITILFRKIRKDKALHYKTKEEIEAIQQMYTRIAAELYIRWGLTQAQYTIARNLLISNGNLQSAPTKRRLDMTDDTSLVARTLGIEIWPAVRVVAAHVKELERHITLKPINIRTQGHDGKFRWKKEPMKLPSMRRKKGITRN